MAGRKWTYEETLLAFDLYCKTSFGRIHYRNPDVIELARILRRTPSSVAMKMVNLASLDPELKKRGIKGLSNSGKLETIVWDDFKNKGSELVAKAEKLMDKYTHEDDGCNNYIEQIPIGTEKEHMTRQRIGQQFFRRAVLASYNYKCCITGISIETLLVASHIKPWSKSDDNTEKTNPCNGLCLNALHDKAFDQGLITLTYDYKIAVSRELKEVNLDNKSKELILGVDGNRITLPDKFVPEKNFIQYHNDCVFRG